MGRGPEVINKLTLEYLHGSSSGQVGYTRVTLTDGREQAFLYGRNQGPVAAAENAASQESPVWGVPQVFHRRYSGIAFSL